MNAAFRNQPLAKEAEQEASGEENRGDKQRNEVENLSRKAQRLLEEGKYQAAADTYRESLKVNPNSPQLHYNLSLALSKLGDHHAEERELIRALELLPNLAEAHNRLGILYTAEGKTVQAEGELRRAIAINPTYAEAEHNLGILYAHEGRNSEAISLFRQATEHEPEYAQAYVDWGLVLAEQGYFLRAKEQFEAAIRVSPELSSAYTALGKALAKLGLPKESVAAFRKVLALNPGSSEAHLDLGFALADQNDMPGALEQFSEALRCDPNSALAHYNRGRLLYQWARNDEARADLEAACRLSPDYPAALYLLALLENHENHIPRSTELSQTLVALDPRNADAQFLLGQNLFLAGKKEEAVQHWKTALELNPNHSDSLYCLARALGESNKIEAKQYRERYEALQRLPQVTEQVKNLGNLAVEAAKARNWSQAVTQLKKALELCGQCPESAHLHKDLGLVYCHSGVMEMGERELQTALKLNPNDEDVVKALEALQGLEKRKTK